MVNALLLLQAAAPVAFDHQDITLFSLGSSRLRCKNAGIPGGIKRRVAVPSLTLVDLSFSPRLCFDLPLCR